LGVINADQKPAGNKKYADYDESTVALLGHVKLGKRKQEIEEMEKIVTEMLMTFD
jgi:hypothetical protein